MLTNKKTNKLEKWLPKCKYIKLFSQRKTCPLTFNERLVFSLLVYASRQKKVTALSQRGIARTLQIDKDTVPQAVANLIQHGLAERQGCAIHAKEPTGDKVNWFVYLSRPGCSRWQDQYGYILIALPAPLATKDRRRRLKLAPHQIAVFCLLLNKEKEGRVDIAPASIAGILGIDVRTVRKSLLVLEECGLVERRPKSKPILVFQATDTHLQWFQARKEQPKKTPLYTVEDDKPWEGMTEREIEEWISDPTASEYARLLRRILYRGRYSSPEMRAIRPIVEQVWYLAADIRVVERLFHEAEKDHQEKQKQGRFLGQNSYHLLRYKLEKYLEAKS